MAGVYFGLFWYILNCFSGETTWLVMYFLGVGPFVELWTSVWASSGGIVFTWNHLDASFPFLNCVQGCVEDQLWSCHPFASALLGTCMRHFYR